MEKYFYIANMGCQMNAYDADYVGRTMAGFSFLPTENPKKADVILINTCSVRAKAEQKAFSLIGRMASFKKRKSNLVLGVMGCIAQQEGSRLIEKYPEIDLVLGTREISRFKELFHKIYWNRERIVATDINLGPASFQENINGYFRGRVKGTISIMQGCNNFCSYCIVPFVRGREISRSPSDIIKESKHLIFQGVKEITFLGQNVNSYYWKGGEEVKFPLLLEEISDIDGLQRIRFTTSHPKDISDELIGCFDHLKNLCAHIHLPFQAGSNKILKLMNRGYTGEKYLEIIWKLRNARPEIAITSDVMVGFPGETDADFQFTLDLIKEVEFDNLFSFKYSDRKGTLAENMDGKIDEREKSARLTSLQQLQKEITLKKNKLLEGKEVEILVEGCSKRGGQLTGRTDTNKVVNFINYNNLIENIVKVKIKNSHANSLFGELIYPI